METPDESLGSAGNDSLSSPRIFAYDYAGLSETLLTNKIMLYAYAGSILIVALGFVGLIIALVILSFFYPDKVQPFINIVLITSPLLAVLIANIGKIKSAAKKIANGKSPNNS